MEKTRNQNKLLKENKFVNRIEEFIHLKDELAEAIEEEEYEEAALIRDQIKRMEEQERNPKQADLYDEYSDVDDEEEV